MPAKSAPCPYLTPKPSKALRAFLLGIHTLSLLAAWLNPLPIPLRLALALSVLLSVSRVWRTKPQITGLKPKPDGSWQLTLADGREAEALLLPSSLFNPWLVLLHLRSETHRYNLLICRDSLDAEHFRQLRVVLQVAARRELKTAIDP